MGRKRIAVITKKQNIAEFFSLEARACACFVKVMPTIPAALSEYDVAIVEGALPERVALDGCRVIRLVADGHEDISADAWEFPVPVSRLRALYEGESEVSVADICEEKKALPQLFMVEDGGFFVMYRNRRIPLTEGEWTVLESLSAAGERIALRSELMELFSAEQGNIADVYICKLRKKLEEPFGIKLISTVRGKGYILLADVKKTDKK